MNGPNVTTFCDEVKFNRFHRTILLPGGVTLIFDGYDQLVDSLQLAAGSLIPIVSYVIPRVMKEWQLKTGGCRLARACEGFVSTTSTVA